MSALEFPSSHREERQGERAATGRTPLFDSYLVVDWSAAAVPRRGRDSIWLCHLRRAGDGICRAHLENPETRLAARERLAELLAADIGAGRSVLAGFDFPFGYPEGFAVRLAGSAADWRSVWQLLGDWLIEEGGNANNRFDVAARLNQRVCAGAAPFWGCPPRHVGDFLGMRHHRRHDSLGIAEQRLADARAKGPQPVWKLYGAGSAGSQALTGIPIVHWLRQRFDGAALIWPFETGLAAPPRRAGQIVFAEIYPSLVPERRYNGEVKDAAQVRSIARYFAALDDAGRLAALFSGAPDLTPDQRRRIEREESWILGVTGTETRPTPAMTQQSYDYLRDPDAIYRESFARVRAEADLSALPEELHALALRLAHAAGDASILRHLVWSEGAVAAGRAALRAGAPILVDAAMVKAGIIERRLTQKSKVLCLIGDKRVPALAKRLGTTRSAAAVELWRPALAGAVVAIGNAPTALFHLLEMIAAGAPKPALMLGFPVGFVGAAEAKAALAANTLGLPFVALAGRRGGSALAAAAVNALAGEDM